jgi:hypothetical protein
MNWIKNYHRGYVALAGFFSFFFLGKKLLNLPLIQFNNDFIRISHQCINLACGKSSHRTAMAFCSTNSLVIVED